MQRHWAPYTTTTITNVLLSTLYFQSEVKLLNVYWLVVQQKAKLATIIVVFKLN